MTGLLVEIEISRLVISLEDAEPRMATPSRGRWLERGTRSNEGAEAALDEVARDFREAVDSDEITPEEEREEPVRLRRRMEGGEEPPQSDKGGPS